MKKNNIDEVAILAWNTYCELRQYGEGIKKADKEQLYRLETTIYMLMNAVLSRRNSKYTRELFKCICQVQEIHTTLQQCVQENDMKLFLNGGLDQRDSLY